MKIAFAGKGGVGKTTLCAWLGDYLAGRGRDVWLVDADTALSLGMACGLEPGDLPSALARSEELVRERIGSGIMCLNPELSGLPEQLAVRLPFAGTPVPGIRPGSKRLLLMGRVDEGGIGCACGANALLKAFLAHIFFDQRDGDVLVDMEAGVEHLGRGTVEAADGLVVVSEPSLRSLYTAAEVARLARQLGLTRQVLVINRYEGPLEADGLTPVLELPRARGGESLDGLPETRLAVPVLPVLRARQWEDGCVLPGEGDGDRAAVEGLCVRLAAALMN